MIQRTLRAKGSVENVDMVIEPILQYVNSFFDNTMIELIVRETNLYALPVVNLIALKKIFTNTLVFCCIWV